MKLVIAGGSSDTPEYEREIKKQKKKKILEFYLQDLFKVVYWKNYIAMLIYMYYLPIWKECR